jgi:hypothetical protein
MYHTEGFQMGIFSVIERYFVLLIPVLLFVFADQLAKTRYQLSTEDKVNYALVTRVGAVLMFTFMVLKLFTTWIP